MASSFSFTHCPKVDSMAWTSTSDEDEEDPAPAAAAGVGLAHGAATQCASNGARGIDLSQFRSDRSCTGYLGVYPIRDKFAATIHHDRKFSLRNSHFPTCANDGFYRKGC